jgi:F-type H+-transporting ATPase subunit b
MTALILLTQPAETEGRIQQIASTFGVDWSHLIAQIISFCIVCILLHRFAYKPVLRMLEERKQQIADGLAEREKIRSELAQAEVQRQDIIAQANVQATRLIEEARTAAARVQYQETQKAITAAEQIIMKARQAAAQEHARMLDGLKREVGQLVVRTAAMVTRKVLTAEDQQRMAEETVRQLGAAA